MQLIITIIIVKVEDKLKKKGSIAKIKIINRRSKTNESQTLKPQ